MSNNKSMSTRLSKTESNILNEPKKIKTKLIIRLIDQVDTQNQSFYATLWIGSTDGVKDSATNAFQDCYNLGPRNEEDEKFSRSFSRIPVWHTTLLNAISVKNTYRDEELPALRKFDDSCFYERMNAKCFFSNPFQLESFPCDHQILAFQISLDTPARLAIFDEKWIAGTFYEKLNNIIIKKNKKYNCVDFDTAYTSILQKTEWTRKDIYLKVTNPNLNENGGEHKYSRLEVGIVIKRKPNHYVTTILIPLFMINLCSIFIFFIPTNSKDDSDIYTQLSLLVTLLLTVFALKWTMSESMPNICHHTLIDRCFFLSYAYLFNCMSLFTYWCYCQHYVGEWFECKSHCEHKIFQKSTHFYVNLAFIHQVIWNTALLAFDFEHESKSELSKDWKSIEDLELYLSTQSQKLQNMKIFYWLNVNVGGIFCYVVVSCLMRSLSKCYHRNGSNGGDPVSSYCSFLFNVTSFIPNLSQCNEFNGLHSMNDKQSDYCSISSNDRTFMILLCYSVIISVLIIYKRFELDCRENKKKNYEKVIEANEKLKALME